MAPTYTRSVAGSSQGANSSTVTSGNSTMRPRLVYPLMEKLDYIKTPITDRVKAGEAVDNPKVEWTSENYRALTATTDTAGYASGATTINLASGQGQKVMLYDIFKNGVTSEYLQVTAISTDALTVVRGVGGSTPAAVPAAATTLTYIGQAVPEHVDSPRGILTRGEFTYNNIQEWDSAIDISYLENNTNNAYLIRGKEYNAELKRQLVELKRGSERTLLLGKRQDSTTTAAYMMGGIGYYITQHTTAKSGALMTEADFLTAAQSALDDVGPEEAADTILQNVFSKRIISSWVDPLRRASANDRKFTNIITTWETEVGTFDFLYSFHMPIDEIWAVNFSPLSRHFYAGMNWTEEPLAKTGMTEVGHVYGAWTLRAPGDRGRWKITGYSTTAGDYPLMAAA